MCPAVEVGLARQFRAIVTVCCSFLLINFSNGFTAVAAPQMKEEMEAEDVIR